MIHINNVNLKHNGLLTDNTTKLTLYLPECTETQDIELMKMAKKKTVGIIIVDPEMLTDIQMLIKQAAELAPERVEPVQPSLPPEINPLEDPLPLFTQILRGEEIKPFAEGYDEGQF